jgi:hypothetical protein
MPAALPTRKDLVNTALLAAFGGTALSVALIMAFVH